MSEPMCDVQPIPKLELTSDGRDDPMEIKPESIFSPTKMSFFQPPPSPGFALHRFGESSQNLGFPTLGSHSFKTTFDDLEPPKEHHGNASAPQDEDTIMSPRAETMINNPLHGSYTELAGMKFPEEPSTTSEGVFSPRNTMFPRDPLQPFGRPSQVADPRSPPTKGETPIVRSIDDVL